MLEPCLLQPCLHVAGIGLARAEGGLHGGGLRAKRNTI